jgi:hypothetical protein
MLRAPRLRLNPSTVGTADKLLRTKDGSATKKYARLFLDEISGLLAAKDFYLIQKPQPPYGEYSFLVVRRGGEVPHVSSHAQTLYLNKGSWIGSYASAQVVFDADSPDSYGSVGYVETHLGLTGFNGPGNASIEPDPVGDAQRLFRAADRLSHGTFSVASRPAGRSNVVHA